MNLRLSLLLPFALVAGCHGEASRDAAPKITAPPKVTIVAPKKASLTRIVEQPGTVRPYEETPLVARLTGYVKKVRVDIGQKVRGPKIDSAGKETEPGEILAELAVPEMEDEATRKRALV